jgi:putative transcriptional regulator
MAKQIRTLLREWRTKKGLSQSQAAKALGISIDTLQNWEQGRNRPSGLATLGLLAKLSETKSHG